MAKLKLDPNPTFKSKVSIPLPGDENETGEIVFTFRFFNVNAFEELVSSAKKKTDAESILFIATGWDLDDEFNESNISRMLKSYAGSGGLVIKKFAEEHMKARLGN